MRSIICFSRLDGSDPDFAVSVSGTPAVELDLPLDGSNFSINATAFSLKALSKGEGDGCEGFCVGCRDSRSLTISAKLNEDDVVSQGLKFMGVAGVKDSFLANVIFGVRDFDGGGDGVSQAGFSAVSAKRACTV